MIKAVLFDMDGTVLDTETMYRRAWKSALDRTGYEFSEKLFNNCVGLPIPMCKKLINEHFDNPDLFDIVFPMAASWAHNYKKMNGIPVKTGFFELSDFLKKEGIKSVIATSTSHEAAVGDLASSKIIDRFNGIIGGDDVGKGRGKPGPDPYIKAAALAGFHVDECIAVEDSINGIHSAHTANVKCVYIRDFLDIPREIQPMIYKEVDTLDKIIDIIKELGTARDCD